MMSSIIVPSTLRRISLGIIPAAAAGLLMVTLLIRIQPSGVSVPPWIVTPEMSFSLKEKGPVNILGLNISYKNTFNNLYDEENRAEDPPNITKFFWITFYLLCLRFWIRLYARRKLTKRLVGSPGHTNSDDLLPRITQDHLPSARWIWILTATGLTIVRGDCW